MKPSRIEFEISVPGHRADERSARSARAVFSCLQGVAELNGLKVEDLGLRPLNGVTVADLARWAAEENLDDLVNPVPCVWPSSPTAPASDEDEDDGID